MAAARRLLVLLATGALYGARAEAQLEAALASDDHCVEGAEGTDGACALNAVQLRGAVEAVEQEESATSRRRHHRHHAQFGHKDITSTDMKDFKVLIHETVNRTKNLTKALTTLEAFVNETYRMVVPTGKEVFNPYKTHAGHKHHGHSHHAGVGGRRRRRHKKALLQESSDAQESSDSVTSRRRRRGLARRAGSVQDWLDELQQILDTEWRRQTRCSRLDQWIGMKLRDPKTPPFQEQLQLKDIDGDGSIDESDAEESEDENEDAEKLEAGTLSVSADMTPNGEDDDKSKHQSAEDLEEDLEQSLEAFLVEEATADDEDDASEAPPSGARAPPPPGSEDTPGAMHVTSDNPMLAHMQGIIDEMTKELGELGDMIQFSTIGADKTRGLVIKAIRIRDGAEIA